MRNRGWIWYFLALAVFAAMAAAIPLLINLKQQLQPDQVDGARALWNERGPRDYNLVYVEKIDLDKQGDEYAVEVRGGKVIRVLCNGQPTTDPGFTIDAIFGLIEKNLLGDREKGQRNYTVADFDSVDGHPRRYVRRVRGTNERLEWRIRLEPADGTKAGKAGGTEK